MQQALGLCLILALVAPWLHRLAGRATGWLLALGVAGICGGLASHTPTIASGATVRAELDWIPSLGVSLSLHLDGLSLVFALLITGIGALVVAYAGGYLAGDPQLGRFYAILIAFMGSMLGVVLADNLLVLFVFWELTSFTSYLLIGYYHGQPTSRAAALQALLVTGGGGLALMAAFLLLGMVGGTFEASQLVARGDAIRGSALYYPILGLILLGAFTKSAQFPFHFWLPNAMEAPTPVSAYLHSSTMVKAGIYLLARLSPAVGGTEAWAIAVTAAGAVTMLLGAGLSLLHNDLKRILAYSTICMLGTITMLLGLGSVTAIEAAMVVLVAHAFYKAALFLVAGGIDHATGTRDVRLLGGLRRAMPITAVAAVLAAASGVGVPVLFGFVGKELAYEALWGTPTVGWLLTLMAVLANALLLAVMVVAGVRPFFGPRQETPHAPHEGPISLWLGPLLLGVGGLILGIFPASVEKVLAAASSSAWAGPVELHLTLWHGFGAVVLLSVLTYALGAAIYVYRHRIRERTPSPERIMRWDPERGYEFGLAGLNRVAKAQTALLQSGYLRVYLMIIILTTTALGAVAVVRGGGWAGISTSGIAFHQVALLLLLVAATAAVIAGRSRLATVAAIGVVGYSVALTFVFFAAPDLAMTQFAIETLTVVLFVFVFYRLPQFARFAGRWTRIRDALISLAMGALITVLVLMMTARPLESRLAPWFAENSVPGGKGRNMVNVILVDFRALDTLGEITVLAVAALGVHALMKLRPQRGGES